MKARKSAPPAPAAPSGALLDWPSQTGCAADLSREVRRRREARRKQKFRAAAAGGLALLLLLGGVWGVPYWRETGTLAVPAARREAFALRDGSRAELNARTTVRTDFRHGRRRVWLDRGEAFFDVVRDATRPFLVITPRGTVAVTGTRFDVRLEEDAVAVTLLDGGVTVRTASSSVALAPGQAVDGVRPVPRTLAPGELADATAWRAGQFAFSGRTLGEAMASLARYHDRAIDVAPEIAGLRPGGRVPLDDLPAAMAAIESALSVRAIPTEKGYRLEPR